MGNDSKSHIVVNNLAWRFAERIGAKGVEFIVSVVLARLLTPELYGTIALVTVFITILQVFVDSGLGNALVQKKDADDLDFSTVFYFNIVFCLLLYIALFFSAPLISAFYNDDSMTPIIRVLGLTVVISGVKNVQQAYVSKNMLFKKFFFATLLGTVGAAVVGIIMAYKGFGVWALVAQQLLNVTVDTIILWITVNWRPKAVFSLKRLKELFSYGWKLLVSHLIEVVYNDIRQLLIGKFYSAGELAYYNRAKQFPSFIITNINTSINSVLFPAMSSEQDNLNRVKSMTRRSIKTSTYIIAPMMIGLAACAETIIKVLLTEKWLPCSPFLVIFSISYIFYPIHTANLSAIKAMGRSDLFLKLEIIKKIVGITALVVSMPFGVLAIAYSLLITSVLSQIINSWPNKKLLNYSYFDQLKDIMPSVSLAVTMGFAVYWFKYLPIPSILTLIIQICVGVSIYLLGSIIFQLESYIYIKNFMIEIIKSKRIHKRV